MGTSDDDDASSAGAGSSSSSHSKQFVLNGQTFTFENPVSLVFAAGRQLGMSVARDVKLLWIADEALLDEYEEEEAAALTQIPAKPLSDEVAEHYGGIFAQRSKPIDDRLVDPSKSAQFAKHMAAQHKSRETRRSSKRDRRRKRLQLREDRLSGVTERYTEELLVALVDSPQPGGQGEMARQAPLNPRTTQAAVWPDHVVPSSPRMLGSLPRIDSLGQGLDALDLSAGDPPSAAPAVEPAATIPETCTTPAQGASGHGYQMPPNRDGGFAIGTRVEVDFDDEGWFAGEVESCREHGGLYIYSVKLDIGELAEDVEGSEICAEGERKAGAEGGSDGSSEHSGSRIANTRSDNLSAFDIQSVAGESDGGVDEDESRDERMQCRVTASNTVEWKFISEEELAWSPPTASLLQAHNETARTRISEATDANARGFSELRAPRP